MMHVLLLFLVTFGIRIGVDEEYTFSSTFYFLCLTTEVHIYIYTSAFNLIYVTLPLAHCVGTNSHLFINESQHVEYLTYALIQ